LISKRDMNSILGLNRQELLDRLAEKSYPLYRADQILEWVYKRGVDDYQAMSNVPGELKELLSNNFALRLARLKEKRESADRAVKLLLQWPDGALTETVLMKTEKRRTVCVSSQVGCPVQCAFCASGQEGLERSLEAGEIVEQVLWAEGQLEEKERISNVVIMGMGEPLLNYENTIKAVRIINAEWGLGIGARHITLSTIGLPEQMRRLAHEPLQITLAVSLHGGDDELRRNLIPWAGKIKIKDIFAAIDYYYENTHREVTLEYVLLDDVNCSSQHADSLARWAKGSRCNVNLIKYNPIADTPFKTPSPPTVKAFMNRLKEQGVNVHLRRSLGTEIDGACGQLRYQHKIN